MNQELNSEPQTCLNCKWAEWSAARGTCTVSTIFPKSVIYWEWNKKSLQKDIPYSDCPCWSEK